MKKNFFKQLACVLSLAMVVSTVAPAGTTASAAAKQSLNATKKILYVGKSFDFGVRNNDTKNYTYVWSTSNKNVATVNTKTGLTTAKKGGKAVVSVKITNKKTKKFTTLKANVEVRTHLKSMKIANPIASGKLEVGRSYDFGRSCTPADATFKGTTWTVSDETIASVDARTGLVTGLKTGKVTVTAQSTVYDKISAKTEIEIVEAVPVLTAATQASATKVEALFDLNVEKNPSVSDFKIVNDETKAEFAIKSATVDETDKKKVTLETFAGMTDGKSYTVSYKDTKVSFTATDGVVTSLDIAPVSIAYDTATEMKVLEKDAKGIVVSEQKLGDVDDAKLEFTIDTNSGYVDGNKLTLYSKGDTAKAKAIYHTYKYDNNGQEIGAITKEVTITAVDKSAINVKAYKYTIGDKPSNWDSVTTNTKLAVNADKTLHLYVKNSDDSIAEDGYTLESSNSDVLIVTDNADLTAGVRALKQGSAYVLVKKDGKTVWSLPITIVAEVKATSLSLDKNSIDLSNTTEMNDSKSVTVKVKDQYGDEMDALNTGDIEVECISSSGDKKADVLEGTHYSLEDNKVTFYGGEGKIKPGTYNYKIKAKDKTQTISVVIKNVGKSTATSTFKIELDNKADIKFNSSNKDSKNINIKVAELKGGVLYQYAPATVEISLDNKVIQTTTTTGPAVVFKASEVDKDSKAVTKAAVGNYKVKVKYTDDKGKAKEANAGFTISDTQASAVSYKRIENVLDSAADAADAVLQAYEFYYNGKTYNKDKGNLTIENVELNGKGSATSYPLKKVTIMVEETVDGDTYSVPVTISISQTILVK